MQQPHNCILQRLPSADRQQLLARCEQMTLPQAARLDGPGQGGHQVYFPLSGLVVLQSGSGGHAVSAGMFGNEGMLGAGLALGLARSPLQATVLEAGQAMRLGCLGFWHALRHSRPLTRLSQHYLYSTYEQLALSAACAHCHDITPRLACWLLMADDRLQLAAMHFTQQEMADILGVRRVGITRAAGWLQDQGLIGYHRGVISILDRPGLQQAACSCYVLFARNHAPLICHI
ncbi:Crp/Fnr family transcriptional regulator [Aquitalea magnusonii]|nr:Crp/Fnr family transcriptional regulator [Aquitalea magnusonii]